MTVSAACTLPKLGAGRAFFCRVYVKTTGILSNIPNYINIIVVYTVGVRLVLTSEKTLGICGCSMCWFALYL